MLLDHVTSQRAAEQPPEHPRLGLSDGEGLQVRLDVRHEERWHGNCPPTGFALRGPEHQSAVAQLMLLLLDREETVEEVDVASLESQQLSDPEPAETRHEDEKTHVRRHRICRCEHLHHRGSRPLCRPLDTRAGQLAGVRDDELVMDRGSENRSEQAIALGRGVGADGFRRHEGAVPLSYETRRERIEVDGTKSGKDVTPELGLIGLAGAETQARSRRQPGRRVLLERDPTGVGIHPCTAEHVGLDRDGEPVRVAPCAKGPGPFAPVGAR